MDLYRKPKFLLAIGITTLFSSLAIYLWYRYRKSIITKSFEKRLLLIKTKFQDSKILNEEICFTIENLIIDLADFFYFRDYINQETLRNDLLDIHDQEYEEICFETLKLQSECIDKAHRYLLSYTGINYEDVRRVIKMNRMNYLTLKQKYRSISEDIPIVDKKIVKEAYIFFADKIHKVKSDARNIVDLRNQDEKDEMYKSMIIDTFRVKDRLQQLYNIDERFLSDLLDKHELRADEEIKLWINRLTSIDEQALKNSW